MVQGFAPLAGVGELPPEVWSVCAELGGATALKARLHGEARDLGSVGLRVGDELQVATISP
jgi:hypothetical protein